MRPILLTVAALAVAASTAAAAGIDLNVGDTRLDDVSTGTSTIEDCTNGLDVDLVPGPYNAAAKDWQLAAVRVSSGDAGLTTRCDGFEMTVVVERGNAPAVVLGPKLVAATVGDIVTFDVTDVLIRPTDELSVLVDEPNL